MKTILLYYGIVILIYNGNNKYNIFICNTCNKFICQKPGTYHHLCHYAKSVDSDQDLKGSGSIWDKAVDEKMQASGHHQSEPVAANYIANESQFNQSKSSQSQLISEGHSQSVRPQSALIFACLTVQQFQSGSMCAKCQKHGFQAVNYFNQVISTELSGGWNPTPAFTHQGITAQESTIKHTQCTVTHPLYFYKNIC